MSSIVETLIEKKMKEKKSSNLWNRALQNLQIAWNKIASDNKLDNEIKLTPNLNQNDHKKIIKQMNACLEARGGEVSARKRAATLGFAYLSLNDEGKKKFLTILSLEYGTDSVLIKKAIKSLFVTEKNDSQNLFHAEQKLQESLKSPRVKLLQQFNALPDGIKFLVDMRSELLLWKKEKPELRGLENDLKLLLSGWFDVGFLELKQITWQAPASLLEKLFLYEAVHEIKDWGDLKNRLAADRRCFGFFHPKMPEEPLIFVWVALVNGISASVQSLLDENAPLGDAQIADTAVFYSISNAQSGLSGINFGNFLIKRVVDSLSKELPNIKAFATLSPIPGFSSWFEKKMTEGKRVFSNSEQSKVLMEFTKTDTVEGAIKSIIQNNHWYKDKHLVSLVREPLTKICAEYLLLEKRESGTAFDSVAHFHLNNGASMEQLNWMADTSLRGIDQSYGLMINYLYDLKLIDSNHEIYRLGETIAASQTVKNLVKH